MSLKAPIPKPHTKICKNKNCKKRFEVSEYMPFAVVCSPLCAIEYAKQQTAKKADKKRKETAKAKREFRAKDKSLLIRKCQALANRYARIRDERLGRGCITCGTKKAKWDGGHFLPTSTYPAIRFYTLQIHKQCFQCNRINSGKPREYRAAMVEMHGIEWVERLEQQRGVIKKYTPDYLNKYISIIGKRLKKLKRRLNKSF